MNEEENIQVFLRMRPLNSREVNEEQAACAWKIIDKSITLDPLLFNGNAGPKFIVPAAAYASLLAPSPGGASQSKAYSFSIDSVITVLYRWVLQP